MPIAVTDDREALAVAVTVLVVIYDQNWRRTPILRRGGRRKILRREGTELDGFLSLHGKIELVPISIGQQPRRR